MTDEMLEKIAEELYEGYDVVRLQRAAMRVLLRRVRDETARECAGIADDTNKWAGDKIRERFGIK